MPAIKLPKQSPSTDIPQQLLNWLNYLPISIMGVVWLAPMAVFWGSAWGPLKPFHYPQADTAPPWLAFLSTAVLCFWPCLLPRSWFSAGSVAEIRAYQFLGIRAFKYVTTSGDLLISIVRRWFPSFRILSHQASLRTFILGTKVGETAHLVLFSMGVMTSLYAVKLGWMGWAVVLTAGNVLANLYPVLLQRYNRARANRMCRRLEVA